MEVITSLTNNKVKDLCKLNMKKYRDESGLFLVCGEHLVLEAEKNNVLVEVIKTVDYEKDFNVKTTYVSYDVLKKISSLESPQKVIGLCKKISNNIVGDKVLLLDDLQDPGNLGTIIRSSVAFGVDTIVLSSNTVDLYNDKVIRASEGMIFNINIIKRDLFEVIDELKNNNYVIYGTKVDGGVNLSDVNKSSKYALIMGNEGNGVKKEILDLCDSYIYIPMDSKCESLNVGVATSIILYELGNK